ncbi:MAG TPA: class I SAM-dependent methyltransferase [Solirubrobacteraceae bacterium]
MVVDDPPATNEEPSSPMHRRGCTTIWHDLECGSYTADLPLWRELARTAGSGGNAQPLLDIGAGTGRVALDLARRGYKVTAFDLDAELLSTLRARAEAASVELETVCGDARELDLLCRDFAVCLVPMQTIQLLGGADGRLAFLTRAREHLREGGLLACAIVSQLDAFDCATGDVGPSPETTRFDGTHYVSRATRVHVGVRSVQIERERTILSAEQAVAGTRVPVEHNLIELDRVSAAQLRHEGHEVGLSSAGTRTIPATRDHVGSEVVLLRA